MNLELVRETYADNGGILGSLYVDGEFFGYTLENAAKAIPNGIYSMFARFSPKFNTFKAALSVPGREYIMFHGANKPTELEGCIGVAKTLDKNAGTIYGDLSGSLYELAKKELDAGNVVITVRRSTNWPLVFVIAGAAVYLLTR